MASLRAVPLLDECSGHDLPTHGTRAALAPASSSTRAEERHNLWQRFGFHDACILRATIDYNNHPNECCALAMIRDIMALQVESSRAHEGPPGVGSTRGAMEIAR